MVELHISNELVDNRHANVIPMNSLPEGLWSHSRNCLSLCVTRNWAFVYKALGFEEDLSTTRDWSNGDIDRTFIDR